MRNKFEFQIRFDSELNQYFRFKLVSPYKYVRFIKIININQDVWNARKMSSVFSKSLSSNETSFMKTDCS